VRDCWRIEDEWWRGQAIKRTYFQVLLEDGREATIFFDHASHAWFRQRYA
jgi:hypothetical protein